MITILCFWIAILTHSVTNGKSISINIDSDDVIKLIGGLMNTSIFKNIIPQFQSTEVKRYNNPFHPEDNLVPQFDDSFIKHEQLQNTKNSSEKSDALDKENENFDDGRINDVIDVLIDNEISENVKTPNVFADFKKQKTVHLTQFKNDYTTAISEITAHFDLPFKKK